MLSGRDRVVVRTPSCGPGSTEPNVGIAPAVPSALEGEFETITVEDPTVDGLTAQYYTISGANDFGQYRVCWSAIGDDDEPDNYVHDVGELRIAGVDGYYPGPVLQLEALEQLSF